MAKVKNKRNAGLADKVQNKKKANANKKTLNPFEVHINKEKLKVLGKKSKHDRGLPGVSRAKAIQKRKETLGTEMKLMNKTNAFIDRRIGEKNSHLSAEDRMVARFAAERSKQHNKKSIYNLADDEILTHRGQTLEQIEKFDDPRSSDDEDEEKKFGGLNDDFVSEGHFGGGVLSKSDAKDGAKSHKDLIEQLIAESKKRKAEKQKEKEQTLDLTEKLDSEWKDLQPVVFKRQKVEEESLIDKLLSKAEKGQDYDKTMRELRFEKRGTPSDGLKSKEKEDEEERKKLEELERQREQRMLSEEEHAVPKSVPTKHRSADDLDDNFELDNDQDFMLAYDKDGKPLMPEHILKDFSVPNARKTFEDGISDSSDDEEGSESGEESYDEDDDKSSDKEDSEVEINSKDHNDNSSNDSDISNEADKIKSKKGSGSDIDKTELKYKSNAKEIKNIDNNLPNEVNKVQNLHDNEDVSNEAVNEYDSDTSSSLSDDMKMTDKKVDKVNNKTQKESDKNRNLKRKSVSSEDYESDEDVELNQNRFSNDKKRNIDEIEQNLKRKQSDSSEDTENEDIDSISNKKLINSDKKKPKHQDPNEISSKNDFIDHKKTANKHSVINDSDSDSQSLESEEDSDIHSFKGSKEMEDGNEDLNECSEKISSFFDLKSSEGDNLKELLTGKTPIQQSSALQKLIKTHDPSLAENNKEFLSKLFAQLLKYINDLFSNLTDESEIIKSFLIFDKLVPHFYELIQINKVSTKKYLVELLTMKHDTFKRNPKKIPDLDTLILFKLVSLLYPTSDFRHPVTTPSLIFMSEILTLARFRDAYSVSRGFFVVCLILEYTVLSKRYVPSALNFLRGVLYLCANTSVLNPVQVVPPFRLHRDVKILNLERDCSKMAADEKLAPKDLCCTEINDCYKIRCFLSCSLMLKEFFDNYNELEALQAIFEPHIQLLGRVDLDLYPMGVAKKVSEVLQYMKQTLEVKTYTQMAREKVRPKALRLYEPDIQDVFTGSRSSNLSRENAEKARLQGKYKREMKGALREIRRDKAYIASVKIRQRIHSDNVRKEKVKQIYKDASIQQGELNKLKRTK